MKILLRIKHWQLFGLLIILPLPVVIFSTILTLLGGIMVFLIVLAPFLMFFLVAVFFGWLYTIGVNLHAKLPVVTSMGLGKFKVFLINSAACVLLLPCYGIYFMLNSSNIMQCNLSSSMITTTALLFLFPVFCIFYSIFFVSKALVAAELQKSVMFKDFAPEFLLILFFPIGLWFIQPRINKLFKTSCKFAKLPSQ